MATDYDAPRKNEEDQSEESIEELKARRHDKNSGKVDEDEAEAAESFELPGADLSHEELAVEVMPRQEDEFTCRIRSDHAAAPQCPGQSPHEGSEDGSVRPVQARPRVGAAQDSDLVAQHEELDVLDGGRATRQQDQTEHLPEDQIEQPQRHVGIMSNQRSLLVSAPDQLLAPHRPPELRTVASDMTGARPGWQPHDPLVQADGPHPSWQFLADTWPRNRATSFRRFWTGSQWEGDHVPNADLLAIAVCPGCDRLTGFIALTGEEEKKYAIGSMVVGSSMLSEPRKIPKRLFTAWRSKDSIKCVDCGTHVSLCPSCKQYSFAVIGFGTCNHCGEEFA